VKVTEPGHRYELDMLDTKYADTHGLTFVKRVGDGYPGNEPPPHHGVIIQEVLRALIDRLQYVNGQSACNENEMAQYHLRKSFFLLELRAWRRHRQGVTGTGQHKSMCYPGWLNSLPLDLVGIEDLPIGPDGHILEPQP